MHAIIVSKKDIAGMNIKDNLLKSFGFKEKVEFNGNPVYKFKNIEIYTIEKDTIHFEECEKEIQAESFIFATRHQSQSGEKTLSVHFPGNFGKAEYGGKEKELCFTNPAMLKHAFINLNQQGKDSGYAVTLEATHHGPFIRKPVMFIEIGSKEEQWKDVKAGEIIARTIMKTFAEKKDDGFETALGFGGSHYCSGFNKIELESNVALGHICTKYNIDSLDEELIRKMMDSAARVDYALIDWKGLDSAGREKVTRLLDEAGVKWKKTKGI